MLIDCDFFLVSPNKYCSISSNAYIKLKYVIYFRTKKFVNFIALCEPHYSGFADHISQAENEIYEIINIEEAKQLLKYRILE